MLIVETGSGIPGANSYAYTSDLVDYAEARGVLLPDSEEEQEALLHKGMDYLRAIGLDFTLPTVPAAIPANIKEAQIVAAIAAMNGDLLGRTSISSSAMATQKTVGPITVKYSTGGSSSNPVAYVPMVYALLRQWRRGAGQPPVIRG